MKTKTVITVEKNKIIKNDAEIIKNYKNCIKILYKDRNKLVMKYSQKTFNDYKKKKVFINFNINEKYEKELKRVFDFEYKYNCSVTVPNILYILNNNLKNVLERLIILKSQKSQTLRYFQCIYPYHLAKKIYIQTKKDRLEHNPFRNHGGKYSPWSKKSIVHSQETIKKSLAKAAANRSYNTRIDYWINKGLSREDACIALSNRQCTFSLKKCIEKFGETDGILIHTQRQIKWQTTLSSKSAEEIAIINKNKNCTKNMNKQEIKDWKKKIYLTKVKNGTIKPIECLDDVDAYYRLIDNYTSNNVDLSKLKDYDKRSQTEYHLDHIISKIEGFRNNIIPQFIGSIENLQMIPALENIGQKNYKCYSVLSQTEHIKKKYYEK